jgi:hypothetical protein
MLLAERVRILVQFKNLKFRKSGVHPHFSITVRATLFEYNSKMVDHSTRATYFGLYVGDQTVESGEDMTSKELYCTVWDDLVDAVRTMERPRARAAAARADTRSPPSFAYLDLVRCLYTYSQVITTGLLPRR